jgi:hypothetical protein
MEESVPFMSRCPRFGYQWLQGGYTRHTLLSLLRPRSTIEAYCMKCAVLWPISAEEKRALSEENAP